MRIWLALTAFSKMRDRENVCPTLFHFFGWHKNKIGVLLSSFLVVQMCTTVLLYHVLCNTWDYRNNSLPLPNSLEQIRRRNKALIAELSEPRPGSSDLHFTTQFSQPFFVQCRACLWKQRCSYWRNQPYTAVRFSFTTITALMLGSMFWDLGGKRWKTNKRHSLTIF